MESTAAHSRIARYGLEFVRDCERYVWPTLRRWVPNGVRIESLYREGFHCIRSGCISRDWCPAGPVLALLSLADLQVVANVFLWRDPFNKSSYKVGAIRLWNGRTGNR